MKKHFQNHLLVFKILILILTFSMLSGCTIQFGSHVITSEYYKTPFEAYEGADDNYNHLEQTYKVIQEEIGILKLDNNYSIYLVIMGTEKDGKIINKYPMGLIMKTENEKYHYVSNFIYFETDKEKQTQSFKTEGKERSIEIIRKDAFDELTYNSESYNISTFSVPENGNVTEMVFAVKLLPKD